MPARTHFTKNVLVPTMQNPIESVIAPGVPAQVFNSVIFRVAVIVAPFHPVRPGANERFQDKAMNPTTLLGTVLRQHHPEMPIVAFGHFQGAPFPAPPITKRPVYTSDTACIRYLVQAFIALHRMPNRLNVHRHPITSQP